MQFKSKKIPFVILAITALALSRAMFALFNDPEGPNLLIVVVMALILFFLSMTAYLRRFSISEIKRFLLAVCIQVIVAAGFYICLS